MGPVPLGVGRDHGPTASTLRRYRWRSWRLLAIGVAAIVVVGLVAGATGSPDDGIWSGVIGSLLVTGTIAIAGGLVGRFRAYRLARILARHPWLPRRCRFSPNNDNVPGNLVLLPDQYGMEAVLLVVSTASRVLTDCDGGVVWVAGDPSRRVAVAPPAVQQVLLARRPRTRWGRRLVHSRALAADAVGTAEHTGVRWRRRIVVTAVTVTALGVAAFRLAIAFGVGPFANWSIEPSPPLPEQRPAGRLPAVLSAEPPGPLVINPATAERIVHDIWRIRERAILDRQLAPMRAVETGAALWNDEIRIVEAWEPERDNVEAPTIVSLAVHRHEEYPAHFLAQVRTRNWGEEELKFMVFTRRARADRWRLALDTNWSTDSLQPVPLAIDDEGYNVVKTLPEYVDTAHAHDLLAGYYQGWKDTGYEPRMSPFDVGGWTTDEGEKLAKHLNHTKQANGRVEHWSFYGEPEAGRRWLYGGEYGVLVCSAVWYEVETEGARQRGDRAGWGPELRPGRYERLLRRGVYMSCVGIPETPGPFAVLGGKGSSRIIGSEPPGIDKVG